MSNTITEEGSMTAVTAASHMPLLDYSGEGQREQTQSPESPLTNIPSMIQDLMEFYCCERQTSPNYLVLLHIASFGKQGSGLGSDESHVAMLTAKIFDIQERSVGLYLYSHLARTILFEQKVVSHKCRKCMFI
ncbi:unnamed protein product [Rodentolepis nana]|uniref:Uncharacterized protein n=1 Tax=Rodentolepis nana TaxID=102285 RepID=A0A0R3TXP9_RODNA|nr:unnamed protein product [Rodentolepis nana]